MGVDKQAEEDEHDDLEEPSEAVEEGTDLLAVGNARVAYHHASDIYGKVAVALEEVGDGEGEEGDSKHEDGIEWLVVEVELVDDIYRQLAEAVTDGATEDKLLRKGEQYAAYAADLLVDELDEHDGEHVGHGVVTTALELEHGAEVMLEVHLLLAKDGKHRCRVGRRHGGGQQQGGEEGKVDIGPAHAREPPDEGTRDEGGK